MIGVYFSTATGRVRWVLFPHTEEELIVTNPGESMLVLSENDYERNKFNLQDFITKLTGKIPDDRHVLIEDGKVLGVSYLCPLCGDETIRGKQEFIKHETAQKGDTFINGKYVPLKQISNLPDKI